MYKNLQNIIDNVNDRIDWDDYHISTALLMSMRSPCHRLHVGCVLVRDNRLISAGYNGFLPGAKHHSIIRDNHEQATIHAEINAITDCTKRRVETKDAIAYIKHYPCINCFKSLVASGIKKIIYLHDYKNDENINKIIETIENPIEIKHYQH